MATVRQSGETLLLGTIGRQVVRPTASLHRNFSWAFVGNLVFSACQWGVLAILAKLGSLEMVGQFALALAITAPVTLFFQLQLRYVQVTDVQRRFCFDDYLSLRRIAMALALLVICAIAAGLGLERQTALVVLVVGIMKVLDGISDVHFGVWQRHERFNNVAWAQMLSGALSAALLAVAVGTTHSIVWAAAGAACGPAAALAYVLLWHRSHPLGADSAGGVGMAPSPPLLPKATRLWQLAILTLPLAFATSIIALQASLPRFLLKAFCDTQAVALYSVASCLLVLISLVTQAMGEAIMPRAATLYQSGQLRRFARLAVMNTATQVSVCIVCTGVFFLFGERLISLLFTPEYVPVVPALVLMSLGFTLLHMGAFGINLLYAGRKFKTQAVLAAVALALQFPAAWLLIGRYGVWGAACSDLLRYAVFMLAVDVHAAWVIRTRHDFTGEACSP